MPRAVLFFALSRLLVREEYDTRNEDEYGHEDEEERP